MGRGTTIPDSRRSIAWISTGADPAWHAAVEEAALRASQDRFFLLWANPRSLHVGKNQNIWSQISAGAVYRDALPVFRRLSGGGTVYHDPGNLNFSLLSDGEPRIDFCKHLGTILPFFRDRGIDAEIRNRSDIFSTGAKFSGNAEYFSGGRVLHHGTLLFDSDLGAMKRYLSRDKGPYRDRSIDSNRSPTRNLKPLFPEVGSLGEFAARLVADLRRRDPSWTLVEQLPPAVTAAARKLRPRFNDPDWIYGNSPPYRMERRIGDAACRLETRRGRIESIELSLPGLPRQSMALAGQLAGCFHAPEPVLEAIRHAETGVSGGLTSAAWIDLLF